MASSGRVLAAAPTHTSLAEPDATYLPRPLPRPRSPLPPRSPRPLRAGQSSNCNRGGQINVPGCVRQRPRRRCRAFTQPNACCPPRLPTPSPAATAVLRLGKRAIVRQLVTPPPRSPETTAKASPALKAATGALWAGTRAVCHLGGVGEALRGAGRQSWKGST